MISLVDRAYFICQKILKILEYSVVLSFIACLIGMLLQMILRYVFQAGFISLQELIMWLHAYTFLMAIPIAFEKKRHVAIDFAYHSFSGRIRNFLDWIGYSCYLLPFTLLIIVSSIQPIELSWKIGERSIESTGLSYTYLIKSCIPLMAFFIFIHMCSQVLLCFIERRKHTDKVFDEYKESAES